MPGPLVEAWPLGTSGPTQPPRWAKDRWTLPTCPEVVTEEWHGLVESLATMAFDTEETSVVGLSEGARELFTDWREHHEPRLRGDLEGIGEWGAKLPGQAGRLALILHVAETGRLDGQVQPHTMAGALELADYFAEHALRTFGAARLDERTRDAQRVLGWLRRTSDDARWSRPRGSANVLQKQAEWPALRSGCWPITGGSKSSPRPPPVDAPRALALSPRIYEARKGDKSDKTPRTPILLSLLSPILGNPT